jgi:hypothetical protein
MAAAAQQREPFTRWVSMTQITYTTLKEDSFMFTKPPLVLIFLKFEKKCEKCKKMEKTKSKSAKSKKHKSKIKGKKREKKER